MAKVNEHVVTPLLTWAGSGPVVCSCGFEAFAYSAAQARDITRDHIGPSDDPSENQPSGQQ